MAKLPNIRIDIASVFKDKGFKQATTASEKLGATFSSLGKQLAAAFSITAVARFAQVSTRAFMDKQKETAQLTSALESLNQAFKLPEVDAFLDKLEDAYKIGGEQLVPAFSQLARVTGDVEKAQNLLNLSLDVAAGTGRDVQSVTAAISRAMSGNTASLGRLNVGLDKNLLKYGELDEILDILQRKFEGSAARAVNTFEGQVRTLSVAADRAQEKIGEGLVDAIAILGGQDGITGAADEMARLADETANVIRGIASLSRSLGVTKGEGFGLSDLAGAIPVVGAYAGPAVASLIKRGQREALEKTLAAAPVLDVEKEIAAARNRAKIQAALDRANKNQLNIEKKKTKEKEKQAKLDKAKAVFDMQKIQIAAALQGKLTKEERTRLQLMQAIEENDADRAQMLTKKLEKLQKDTQDLATALTSLEAGDPFDKWDEYFTNAKKMVTDLFDSFKKQSALLNDLTKSITDSKAAANAAVLGAKTDKATAYANAADASANSAALATADAAAAITAAANAIANAATPEEKVIAEEFMRAAQASADAAAILTESVAAAEFASALSSLQLANEYLNQSIEATTQAGIIPEVNVTVNVAGNVTTEQDLTNAITDQLYQYQKSGKGLLYSAVAI